MGVVASNLLFLTMKIVSHKRNHSLVKYKFREEKGPDEAPLVTGWFEYPTFPTSCIPLFPG